MRKFLSEPFAGETESRPELVPFNPHNPQQQSDTGHAKDNRARGSTMRINPSIRSPLFALELLTMSAASYAHKRGRGSAS